MFILSHNHLSHLVFLFQLAVIFQYQVLKCISQNNYFNLFFIDTNLILAALKGLSVQFQELINKQDAQESLLQAIATKVGLSSSKGFITKNNLKIPFKGIEEFIEFDTKLENDMFREEFVS